MTTSNPQSTPTDGGYRINKSIRELCVFARQHWAVSVGLLAALVQAILAFFWLFTPYWKGAMVVILIDMFVLYGLSTYGITEQRRVGLSPGVGP